MLYVLLCILFECACPDPCMCMTMAVSVCVYVFVTPSITSYHCSIMEKCLGNFIIEPGCSGDLEAGGPAQRAPVMLKR